MKQYEAVIETLETLGGIATLGQLNHEVFKIEDCVWKTKTPDQRYPDCTRKQKSIRRRPSYPDSSHNPSSCPAPPQRSGLCLCAEVSTL